MEEDSPEFQQNTVEFLSALNDETREVGAITFRYDLIKLGGHFGFSEQQTLNIIGEFLSNGYIRYLKGGSQFEVTQLGRQIVKSSDLQQEQAQDSNPKKKYCVFISHIHECESVALKLKEFLQAIFGDEIDVFVSGDPQNIPAGQDWFATILSGIRQSDCMVILCSPQSVERKWIHFEAGAAAALERKIIPICFAGLNPGMLPSPLDHIRKQAIDCSDPKKLKQYFEILVRDLAEYSGGNVSIVDVLQSEFYRELQQAHLVYQEQLRKSRGRVIYQIEDDYQI